MTDAYTKTAVDSLLGAVILTFKHLVQKYEIPPSEILGALDQQGYVMSLGPNLAPQERAEFVELVASLSLYFQAAPEPHYPPEYPLGDC